MAGTPSKRSPHGPERGILPRGDISCQLINHGRGQYNVFETVEPTTLLKGLPLEIKIPMTFGRHGRCQLQIAQDRLTGKFLAPTALGDLSAALASALETPTDYPCLRLAIVPGDRVTIVIDRQTPQAESLVLGLWKLLEACGVEASDLYLLVPASVMPSTNPDLRRLLPPEVREHVALILHDPTDESSLGYLATTTGGERIYLSKELLNADLAILVGVVAYDPVLGYRGGGSAIYPGLSNVEAMRKSVGQGHDELAPDDVRPLRQAIDEVSWLLGLQFAVQVVPSIGNGVSALFAGQLDSSYREARAALHKRWTLSKSARSSTVVVAIDHDANGHSWSQLGAALDVARQLVSREGRIIALTELRSDLSPGIQLLREVRSPRDALKPLRELHPPDMLPAIQLARTLDWAGVSLLSGLPGDLVEELGMLPFEDIDEVERLIETEDSVYVIQSAQHIHVER